MFFVACLLAVSVGARSDGDAEAIVLGRTIRDDTTRSRGSVAVIGDSVLLGSAIYSPTLPARLAGQGWGPIRFRAGVGYKAGPVVDSVSGGWWIQHWRDEGFDADHVIVNLGANDAGICGTSVSCSRRRILDLVNVIGPGKKIWWPQVTLPWNTMHHAAAWNTALKQIAAERSNVYTWDWPREMAIGGYSSPDNVHLDPAGYRRRSQRMAAEFTDAVRWRDTRFALAVRIRIPTG